MPVCLRYRPNRCFPASPPRSVASFQPFPGPRAQPRRGPEGAPPAGPWPAHAQLAALSQHLAALPAAESLTRSGGTSRERRWPEMQPAARQVTSRWGRRRDPGVSGAELPFPPRLPRGASAGEPALPPQAAAREGGDHRALPAPRTDTGRGPPGPTAALPLPSAARGERPGPAAAPASASSPSVPCLLPPPGGRLRGEGGREGARPKGVAGREV